MTSIGTRLRIRHFAAADVPLGMRLKALAGWNQLEADWQRMLEMQPDGCFVAERDAHPVGTVMTCIFGSVAWIAMMLVEVSLRGQGIGRALMEHALRFLDGQEVRTIRLDATPLGQPLYEKLGFVPEYSLTRHTGIPTSGCDVSGVTVACDHDYDAIFILDQSVTCTDRRKFLIRLLSERPALIVREGGELHGYLLTRGGFNATQIGPCIADELAGPRLLRRALADNAGRPVFIDIPLTHQPASALAGEHGLAIQRHLLRMCRGEKIHELVERLWSSSGPELG